MRTGQHVCFRASRGHVLVGKDVSCTDWKRDLIGIAHKTANRDTQANCPTVAMNAGSLGGANDRTTMSSSSNTSIAKKARTKAEVDFATWLMMAKLGGFDDLPSNAQGFLTNYRARLETMSEAESTALAVREVYSAYYSQMGGAGAAPEPKARTPTTEGKVVRVHRRPKTQPASSAARNSTGPMIRKSLAALLIFASMVALIVTYRFLTQ
jgi:hypothetical protein